MRTLGGWLRTAAIVSVVAAAMAGCGGSGSDPAASPSVKARPEVSPASGDHEMSVVWAGVERTWTVHAPPGYRPGSPTPLVVAVHGMGQTVQRMRASTGLDAVADREDFLVAYPVGLKGAFSALSCCGTADDVGFLRALVDKLVAGWSVDPARVYATGFSVGADMTMKLAVEASDVFTAVAPVSGGFRGGRADTDDGYKPSRPVSVITFVGDADANAKAIQAGLARWQRLNECVVAKPAWADKARTVSREVSGCAGGGQVVAYTVTGMGHNWPSAAPDGFRAAVDASVLMWDFFAAHPRRP